VRRVALLLALAAAAPAGELATAENAVRKAAALARPAAVTVITPDARDFDLTGVVIAPGVVLTARSPLLKDRAVVPALSVRLPDRGTTLEAELLDDDAETDTALFKVDNARVKPLSPARSDDIGQGMWVLLVGNAFGQGRESTSSLSLGVVSAVSRDREGVRAFHTSALVNPGSVGAPVVDLTGDLVGIAGPLNTPDAGHTVVIPYDAIRRAYQAKGGKGAKVVGRPPPPRLMRNDVTDQLPRVLEDAARRGASVLVAVRALPLAGEGEVPVEPVAAPPEEEDPSKAPSEPPAPRRVPGARPAYDRSSGLVIAPHGLILCPLRITGWPREPRALMVDMPDGRSLAATLLGRDERLRLALLKVDARDLPVLARATAETLRAGRFAVALGYPHMRPEGDTPQMTLGILSRTGALGRIHGAFDALATDAGVSAANRGGPLVDVDGRLLGVLLDVNDTDLQGYFTRARGAYAGNAGLGFAVPWTVLDRIVPRLEAGAVLKAAFLGIATAESADGLEVVNVVEKNSRGEVTAAKGAGITKGDILLAIGETELKKPADVRAALAPFSAGDKVTVKLVRNGSPLDLSLTLTEP
jgi:S1-C subfamily serine protease